MTVTADATALTIQAAVQATAPPRILLTVSNIPTGTRFTIYRVTGSTRTIVRGASGITPTVAQVLIYDNEAPFGADVFYALVTSANVETDSNTVQLQTDTPWLTNPITGDGVALTIQDWPELTYAARLSVLDVAGRAAPVVVSDLRTAPTSDLTVLTRTQDQLQALRHLLAPGDIIQLRAVCSAVEGDYLAIGDVVETRFKPNSVDGDPVPAGSDWRRLVSMSCTSVDQPSPALPAVGDTLMDLHLFVPTTLLAISQTWPSPPSTLLTIAQAGLHTSVTATGGV